MASSSARCCSARITAFSSSSASISSSLGAFELDAFDFLLGCLEVEVEGCGDLLFPFLLSAGLSLELADNFLNSSCSALRFVDALSVESLAKDVGLLGGAVMVVCHEQRSEFTEDLTREQVCTLGIAFLPCVCMTPNLAPLFESFQALTSLGSVWRALLMVARRAYPAGLRGPGCKL